MVAEKVEWEEQAETVVVVKVELGDEEAVPD